MAQHSLGEPAGNVGMVCDAHAPQPNPLYFHQPLDWFVGKCVKLGFPVGPSVEHMWVDVKGPGRFAHELRGLLANDSIYDPSLLEGAEIEFNRNEVEAVWDQ
jgi:hypothetical protein